MNLDSNLGVVVQRRPYNRPIELPVQEQDRDERQLESIEILFQGTTPLGLELIRKKIYQIRKRLKQAGVRLEKHPLKDKTR